MVEAYGDYSFEDGGDAVGFTESVNSSHYVQAETCSCCGSLDYPFPYEGSEYVTQPNGTWWPNPGYVHYTFTETDEQLLERLVRALTEAPTGLVRKFGEAVELVLKDREMVKRYGWEDSQAGA